MIKLAIFDLDGTLVDSSVDITNALNYALSPYGFPVMTTKQTTGMVGEGLTRLIEKVIGSGREDIKPLVIERFIGYYSSHLVDHTVPYGGVREALEDLGSYRKAVLSNKRESLSRKLLEDLGLAKYFDVIVGSDSVGERKPSPRPVLYVLELMSLRPEEAVIIGDSNYDIEAGRAAGVKTIAVTYGFQRAASLGGADVVIDDIRGVAEAISMLDPGE